MSIPHVILLFVVGPIAVAALCYLLAGLTSGRSDSAKPYRLGEKWDRGTLWFVGRPKHGVSAHEPVRSIEASEATIPQATMVGGASGTW